MSEIHLPIYRYIEIHRWYHRVFDIDLLEIQKSQCRFIEKVPLFLSQIIFFGKTHFLVESTLLFNVKPRYM